jgi:hypothetical protein
MGYSHGTTCAQGRQPFPFHEPAKQSCPERASDVMLAFRPVETFARKGTAEPRQRNGIDVQSAKKLPAGGCHSESCFGVTQQASSQELVPQGDRQNTGEVVIACAGKSQIADGGHVRTVSKSS